MTTVLHLGHQLADLTGASGLISTDAAGFDSNLDNNALKITSTRGVGVPVSLRYAAPSGDLWFQCRYVSPAAGAGSISFDGGLIHFHDAADDLIVSIATQAATNQYVAVALGDTTVTGTSTFSASNATAYWIDVRVSVGANIVVDLYVDGSLVSTATAANTGGKGVPVATTFPNVDLHSAGSATTWYLAHFAAVDGTSTVGRRFARRRASAAATHTDWLGAVADMADGDAATRMGSTTAAERQSWSLTGPTGPGTGTIAGVHLKLRAQQGSAGPTKANGSLRISSTDYDSTAQTAATAAPDPLFFSWATNPATAGAWTSGTLPTEVGMLSAT